MIEKIKTKLSGYKRGMINIGGGVNLVVGLVVIAIVGSVGASILASNQATQVTDSTAYNITGYGLDGLLNFAAQLGNVGQVGGLALILSVLAIALWMFWGKSGEQR